MNQLLQQFEKPVADRDGAVYDAYLYGRGEAGDTWKGWLAFERQSDRQRFETPIETTQSSAEAVVYWATGLTETYFDGALERAMHPRIPDTSTISQPLPLAGGSNDERRSRLAALEHEILGRFTAHRITRLLTSTLMRELPHTHAAVVRALEDLEKQARMLVRRSEEGDDWIYLTETGVRAAGLEKVPHTTANVAGEPPKASR